MKTDTRWVDSFFRQLKVFRDFDLVYLSSEIYLSMRLTLVTIYWLADSYNWLTDLFSTSCRDEHKIY
jgi:hypothetical protein